MQKNSIGLAHEELFYVYLLLAYAGTPHLLISPNVLSQSSGGTTTTTLMNLIGGIVGYLITYFKVAPRIGRMKSVKRVGIFIGLVSLVFCAMICLVPPTNITLWCFFFVLVLITTQLWPASSYPLIGNWLPRRKARLWA
jgi:hypothetical protein